jgi:hypothetical protein
MAQVIGTLGIIAAGDVLLGRKFKVYDNTVKIGEVIVLKDGGVKVTIGDLKEQVGELQELIRLYDEHQASLKGGL